MKSVRLEDLSIADKELLKAAEEVMINSYNPYSHFYVGAAIRLMDRRIVTGTNCENAAYGSTICAERAAILRANSMGERQYDAVAIIAKGETFDTTSVTGPCGSCRQMLFESSQLSGKDLEIIMSTTKKDKIIVATISELLPLGFGPIDLGIDVKKYIK